MDCKNDAYKASGYFITQTLTLSLLFIFFVFSFPSSITASGGNNENCSAEFYKDAKWAHEHIECYVTVELGSCNDVPQAIVEGHGCYAAEGEELIGMIVVLDEGEPIAIYQVIAIDGIVEEILIEDL